MVIAWCCLTVREGFFVFKDGNHGLTEHQEDEGEKMGALSAHDRKVIRKADDPSARPGLREKASEIVTSKAIGSGSTGRRRNNNSRSETHRVSRARC